MHALSFLFLPLCPLLCFLLLLPLLSRLPSLLLPQSRGFSSSHFGLAAPAGFIFSALLLPLLPRLPSLLCRDLEVSRLAAPAGLGDLFAVSSAVRCPVLAKDWCAGGCSEPCCFCSRLQPRGQGPSGGGDGDSARARLPGVRVLVLVSHVYLFPPEF